MEQSFHYLLMANQAMVHKSLLAELKDTELTIGQPKILDYLREHDGVSQKEIAKACYIEPGSLTVLLNRMEEKKMVERRMKDGNRRSLYVFLTSYGKELAESVKQGFLHIEEQAFSGISKAEQETFLKLFQKITENMNSMEE